MSIQGELHVAYPPSASPLELTPALASRRPHFIMLPPVCAAIDRTSVHRLTSGQVIIDLQTAGGSESLRPAAPFLLSEGLTSLSTFLRETTLQSRNWSRMPSMPVPPPSVSAFPL